MSASTSTGHFARTPEQPWAWRVQRESLKAGAAWWCGCSCGWLETGWPNYEIAKRSMEAHLSQVHPAGPVSGRGRLPEEPK